MKMNHVIKSSGTAASDAVEAGQFSEAAYVSEIGDSAAPDPECYDSKNEKWNKNKTCTIYPKMLDIHFS